MSFQGHDIRSIQGTFRQDARVAAGCSRNGAAKRISKCHRPYAQDIIFATNLREVFNAIDLDKNGKLSRDELQDLLTHFDERVTEDHVKLLIESLDLDSTGYINFEEFTTLFA